MATALLVAGILSKLADGPSDQGLTEPRETGGPAVYSQGPARCGGEFAGCDGPWRTRQTYEGKRAGLEGSSDQRIIAGWPQVFHFRGNINVGWRAI